MVSTTPTPLPSSPGALRDLVLDLLQKQQQKESELAEHTLHIARQEALIAQKDQYIAVRDETIARLENTVAKLQRWRFGRRSEHL
ncbi:IS66 family transposase, partial [Acidithiobacillus sp. VAN18-1]|nr:IS66 family transposase [Igneacidithiobacillus copahuensis]